MSFRRFSSAIVLVLLGGLLAAGCAVNPATGKRQLTLIGERQEIELGQEYDKQIVASMGLYDDPGLQDYLQALGRRLAAVSERPELGWQFRVVDDPVVNAFALPGGFIYITRGIMTHLNSEAELASVVGHEIGHVTARHSVNQMSKAQLAQLGLGLGLVFGGDTAQAFGDLAQQSLGLLFLKFGRDDERQADDLGLRYLVAAGYDPRPMPGVFEVLRRVGEASGGERAPAWLSTHPAPENRQARLDEQIAALARDFSGRPVEQAGYYRRLENMVFGENPREGYFKNDRFYHPDLEFVLDFPAGWKTINTRQAVAGVSQAQDALVRLSLASQSTPDEALRAFFQQQGVQAGSSWRERIHGYDVASREFAAATQQGVLRGLVVFLKHGNNVFGLLGYTPEAKWDDYRRPIQDALASFDRLTDAAALAVQPKRLKIVQPPSSMTVQQFADRYQATVPVETLALINHVEVDDRLQAGRSYKVVQGGRLP